MIVLIAELFGVPYKTAENHFNYLIKSKQLYDLKCGGHVVATQATTTNRTAITTQKLLRKEDSPIVFFLRRPPCHRFRLHHHSFSSIFKRYLFRGKPREIQHHLWRATGTGNGGGGDGWRRQAGEDMDGTMADCGGRGTGGGAVAEAAAVAEIRDE